MNAYINAGIRIYCSPAKDEYGEGFLPEKESQEKSQCKGIGGMAGGKTISSSPFAVKDMHELGKWVVGIGGPHPFYPGTNEAGTYLIGIGDEQSYGNDGKQGQPSVEIPAQHIQNGCIHRHPNDFTGE